MKDRDNIIVFNSYKTSMEAHLAKTKLDAYGIPCFLTEENLANLYPIHNPRFSVRLHIFEQDAALVQQVLEERTIPDDEDLIRCPRCHSVNIESGYSKKLHWKITSLLLSLLVAIFPPKKVRHCMDCDHEF
ncbi:MAG: hypothetical protein KF687_06685 [Cyclobacteriaceae bacterium]|nr:hypothetical protein [Cyclobacteriaceae bacterium]